MSDSKSIWDNFDLGEGEYVKKDSWKIPQGNTEVFFLTEPRFWKDLKEKDEVKARKLIVEIRVGEKEFVWFIDGKKFVILKGIKALGDSIKGKKAIVGRQGERSSTLYSFTQVGE